MNNMSNAPGPIRDAFTGNPFQITPGLLSHLRLYHKHLRNLATDLVTTITPAANRAHAKLQGAQDGQGLEAGDRHVVANVGEYFTTVGQFLKAVSLLSHLLEDSSVVGDPSRRQFGERFVGGIVDELSKIADNPQVATIGNAVPVNQSESVDASLSTLFAVHKAELSSLTKVGW